MTDNDTLMVDRENIIDISKPVFYGFILFASATMFVDPSFAGTILGISVMAAIAFVSAGLSEMLDDDWKRFLEIIAVITLLGAVLAGSYIASMLSMM